MVDEDGLSETPARAAPDDEVPTVLSKVVGSTISETHTMLLDPTNSADRDHLMLPPWAANQQLIADLFTPAFQRSRQCPGRKKSRCCKAQGDQPCFPKWREREDPEWYALEINKYLSIVNQRLGEATPIAAALAADEAFELGCLFTEALIKFQWDKHATSGKKSWKGAKLAWERRRRAGASVTVAAVDELLKSVKSRKLAYALIAEEQGVSAQTIRKEYCKAKKQG